MRLIAPNAAFAGIFVSPERSDCLVVYLVKQLARLAGPTINVVEFRSLRLLRKARMTQINAHGLWTLLLDRCGDPKLP